MFCKNILWEHPRIKKSLLLTSSQNVTVPAGCLGLKVTLIGGGRRYILGNGNPSPGTSGAVFLEWEELE